MTSPAQRHMMRVSAVEAAQRGNHALRHATGYEQMLVKLSSDKRTLKGVRSINAKRRASVKCCRTMRHG